ncbi:MAG: hypothetical protein AAGJ96_12755, partial [Pseudomonadota bacterium]
PGADTSNLLGFIHDRLKVYLRADGIRHDVIDACLAMPGNDDLVLLVARARALQAGLATEDGANLVQGYKRANNILTAEEKKDGVEYSFGPDPKLAEAGAEAALFEALDAAEPAIASAVEGEDFEAAMGRHSASIGARRMRGKRLAFNLFPDGNLSHRGTDAVQKVEAVAPDHLAVGIDHDIGEEGVDRRAQGRHVCHRSLK